MVLFVSACLWAFLILVGVRVTYLASRPDPDSPHPGRTLALLALLAAITFMRPHELLLGGQDPGVYLNAAGAFARQQQLFTIDPLLAEVEPENRTVFWFGHLGYGFTKDSCLQIKDLDTMRIGPRFPPTFSILLSPLMRSGPPFLGLYVVPLFAILTGITMFALARRLLLRRGAGPLAFLFYLATPFIVWHARAPRPEILAGFLALAGFLLCLHAWQARQWRCWPDLLLGALCIALAPFFHITTWFIAVAAVGVMLAWILTGRSDAWLYPPVALAGLATYVWHTLRITDHYQLGRFLRPCLAHPAWLTVAALLALAVPILLGLLARRLHRRRRPRLIAPDRPTFSTFTLVRALAALTLVTLCAWMFLRLPPPGQRALNAFTYHYAHPADLRLVPVYFSAAIAASALAGLLVLILTRRPGSVERLAFCACFLPGALLIGPMHDWFMTRYMLPALCPLLIMGLAALATALPVRVRHRRAPLLVAAILILALLWHQRTAMITTTEYRGLGRFLASFAAPVRAAQGMLLVEYARLGAPLEHLFGVPLLSLDNEIRNDYTPALNALDRLMTRHPARPVFLLTPYPTPRSERFTFTPVMSNALTYARLPAGRYRRPDDAQPQTLPLHLFRITPTPPPPPPLPFTRWPDAGNFGLIDFSDFRTARWRVHGIAIPTDQSHTITLTPREAASPDAQLLLFVHAAAEPATHAPIAVADPHPASEAWTPLGQGWGVLRLPATTHAGESDTLTLRALQDVVLNEMWIVDGARASRLELPESSVTDQPASAPMRWALPPVRFLAPVPGQPALMTLLVAPPDDASNDQHVVALSLADREFARWSLPPQRWSWLVHPLPQGETNAALAWLTLHLNTVPGATTRSTTLPTRAVRVACLSVLDAPVTP